MRFAHIFCNIKDRGKSQRNLKLSRWDFERNIGAEMSNTVQLVPNPADFAKSIRGLGYAPASAIADLIDNSITANAQTVRIAFDWNGGDPRLSLTDDGIGMIPETLTEAMRLGTDPEKPRRAEDLGRFGMGLKTASLSQARSLTVATKIAGGRIAVARWDLDHIEATRAWTLQTGPDPEMSDVIEPLENGTQGTLVLWRKLDLLFGTGERTVDHFLQIAEGAADHLGMIFHRFIDSGRLEITINGSTVSAWDPLALGDPNCRKLPPISVESSAGHGEAIFAGCILPGPAVRTAEQEEAYGGSKGWLAQQGFYVYRANRMIVSGGWLNLGRGGHPWRLDREHVLARMSLDISNASDIDWALDIRKSSLTVPQDFKPKLQRAALEVRRLAKAALTARPRHGQSQTRGTQEAPSSVLIAERVGALVRFRLDRRHPLVAAARRKTNDAVGLTALLDRIDADLPLQPNVPTSAFRTASTVQLALIADVIKLAKNLYYSLRKGSNLSPTEALARMLTTIPQFREHETAIAIALESYEIELERPDR